MYQILPLKTNVLKIRLPGSKSVSHRTLILSALNESESIIENLLGSADTDITLKALRHMGARIEQQGNRTCVKNPICRVKRDKIYLGNSGSSARFLIPLPSYLDKPVYFYGEERLHQRPMTELMEALETLGANLNYANKSLPLTVVPAQLKGGAITFSSLPSSQIITSLMMSALWMGESLLVTLPNRIPSLPYVSMTFKLMRRLGLDVSWESNRLRVHAEKPDFNWNIKIEKDLSAASYWVVLSMIHRLKLILYDVALPSLQGDERIFEIAEQLGSKVTLFEDRLEIEGDMKKGGYIHCADIPDLVPALSVLALFAPEKIRLADIAHLRFKESDRIKAIQENLYALGGKAQYSENGLTITPAKDYKGAMINSYNDHRIAMSFAVAGTKINGIYIDNPGCVNKSYPGFWQDFTFWKNE